MKNKWRKLVALSLGICMLASLSACGKSDSEEPKPQEAAGEETPAEGSETGADSKEITTVTLWLGSWWDGEVDWLCKQFAEDNPGYELKIELQPIANYQDNATSAILGGQGPDVLALDTLFLPSMMSQGLLLPLDDFMAEAGFTADMFTKCVYDAGTNEGKQYALPYRFTCSALYYNKTMFDNAQIPYPDGRMELDEFYDICEKLTTDGKYGYGIAASKNDLGNTMTSFAPFLWGAGGDFLTEDLSAGAMTTPEALAGLHAWCDLYNDGLVPEGCINYAITADLFPLAMNGEIAMLPMGDSNIVKIDEFAQQNNFEWGVTLHPGYARAAGWSVTIPSSCKQVEAAEVFIKWFLQPEIISQNNTVLPGVIAAQDMGKWADPIYDIYIEQAEYAIHTPNTPAWSQIQLIVVEELQNALSKAATVEEAAENMNKRIDELLK